MSNLLAEIERRRQLEAIRGKAHPAVAAQAAARAATGPTLNDVLKARGYYTTPAAPGRKNVHDVAGRVVLENVTAAEVWDYLRGARSSIGGGRALSPSMGARKRKAQKAKKRKAKKRAKAAKTASTPKPPKKKKAKKRRAKKPKKAKKKKAKAPKRTKAKKKKKAKKK